jgi:hypothetical protein
MPADAGITFRATRGAMRIEARKDAKSTMPS